MLNNSFWHNLLKDPKDLPKTAKEVLVVSVAGINGMPTNLAYYTSKFNLIKKEWESAMDNEIIVAWAEIPDFYDDFLNYVR